MALRSFEKKNLALVRFELCTTAQEHGTLKEFGMLKEINIQTIKNDLFVKLSAPLFSYFIYLKNISTLKEGQIFYHMKQTVVVILLIFHQYNNKKVVN